MRNLPKWSEIAELYSDYSAWDYYTTNKYNLLAGPGDIFEEVMENLPDTMGI